MAQAPAAGTRRIRLWDLPVRLVHWSLVLLLPALWWSWRQGEIDLHKQLGYITLFLLLFRLAWGLVGSETARFASFVKGPGAVLAYLRRGSAGPVLGHNPLGGWSVLLLLGLMSGEAVLGLFTQDVDGIESGPLTSLVSYDTADAARGWHDLLFDLTLVAVALHLAAILFYLLARRDNLIAPMVTGRKAVAGEAAEPARAPWWRAALVAAAAAAFTWWVSKGCPL